MFVDFSALELALASLKKALDPAPRNDRERDGAIQRFEYTFELCWKTSKKVLEKTGIHSTSPKTVIRDMGQQGWINDVELWFDFLEARNASTHTNQITAEQVFENVEKFAEECQLLVGVLKNHS